MIQDGCTGNAAAAKPKLEQVNGIVHVVYQFLCVKNIVPSMCLSVAHTTYKNVIKNPEQHGDCDSKTCFHG